MTKVIHKLFGGGAEALADKRQVKVNVSSAAPDRVGDIIVQEGIDFAPFMKLGGTILWQHDGDQPIAKAIELAIVDGKLQALAQFPPAGISPKADEVLGLIGAGVINASSIGFAPREWTPLDPKEPWGAQKFDKIELMEFSFVSVPANPDAAILARAANGMGFSTEKAEREFLAKGRKADSNWKVGASRNLPLGGDDAWDGPGAEASIFEHAGFDGDSPDYSFARKGFLAYDAANPTLKSSYRLPFAKVADGRLTAIPSGILAASSGLSQAGISNEVQEKSRAALDHYEAKMKDGKSYLVGTKSFAFLAERKATEAELDELVVLAKSGRVLSAENMDHLDKMMKCLGKAVDCQTKVLDLHGDTHDQLQQMAQHVSEVSGHCKALMENAKKPPKGDDEGDDADESGNSQEDANVELAAQVERRKRLVAVAELAAAP